MLDSQPAVKGKMSGRKLKEEIVKRVNEERRQEEMLRALKSQSEDEDLFEQALPPSRGLSFSQVSQVRLDMLSPYSLSLSATILPRSR
jgi:hypothetical protein